MIVDRNFSLVDVARFFTNVLISRDKRIPEHNTYVDDPEKDLQSLT